jgi:cell division protein FtsI/penicillin-binding protein 2
MIRALRVRRAGTVLLASTLMLAACGTDISPTPAPTSVPTAEPQAAVSMVEQYLAAWRDGAYDRMHRLLAPADAARFPVERFVELHEQFAQLAAARIASIEVGEPRPVVLPPEPRPPDLPPPAPPPSALDPNASPAATPQPTPTPDPNEPLAGPIPAIATDVELAIESDRFGSIELDRRITLAQGADGWQVRWSPELLFPQLGTEGGLALERLMPQRGSIRSVDGTVFATLREDGVRVYPQETLAGQVIGYVSEVTAEDLEARAGQGYRAGDVVGRSGLEAGAERLLRGSPGYILHAVAADGTRQPVLEQPMVDGADLTITIRPEIQGVAEASLQPYAEGATAVIDPRSGDVWALASRPLFNPNAATLGTDLAGATLPEPSFAQTRNKALLGAYPAGSAFKPFTLAVALKLGVATPQTRMTCLPTWDYGTWTFRNYMDHTLPGEVSMAESMAFSCNTTYMPLALQVYQEEPFALTDLLFEFGFGEETGIRYLAEDPGLVPDDDWLRENGRGGYSAFEQIQLSIGQGAFLGTQLQLANAFAAIGNGGTLWTPRIVVRATLPDGTEVEEIEPGVRQRVSVSAEDLAHVTETLRAVVTLPYGTGTGAFSGFGVPVAGKSGTAETGAPDPHALFPAFAPADDPTIAVSTILIHTPLATGGANAAPIVRQVMAEHFAASD